MFRNRLLALLLAVCCIAGLSCGAAAAEVDCDSVYCFSAEDFPPGRPLLGVCITSLPDKKVGTISCAGRDRSCPGDILTAKARRTDVFSA